MVASMNTLKDALEVIKRHVPDKSQRGQLLRDLSMVSGNVSFSQTMQRVALLDDGCSATEVLELQKRCTPAGTR